MIEPAKNNTGRPILTTVTIRQSRSKKMNVVLEWIYTQSNMEVQQNKHFVALAIKTSAKKPLLYILTKQDMWHWFDRAAALVIDKCTSWGEALSQCVPLATPVSDEIELEEKLTELKGKADHGREGTDGEAEGERPEGSEGDGVVGEV